MRRKIVEEDSFKRSVEAMGGALVVDMAMSSVIDGLNRNPYGFHLVDDWIRFRYAITKPIDGVIPALCVVFKIDEDGDVHLEHVEESETF